MSAIRSIAQIPASIKYLEVVISSLPFGPMTLASLPAFRLDSGKTIADIGAVGSVVTEDSADLDPVTSVEFGIEEDQYPVGTLFKDLGRQLLVVNAAGAHLALFRQVQWVSGDAGTEGVGGSAPNWNCLFVKVWSAVGTNVCVVRTGPGSA